LASVCPNWSYSPALLLCRPPNKLSQHGVALGDAGGTQCDTRRSWMSVVTLQLGQCGNQLGEEVFDLLRSEATRARPALAAAVRQVYFSERSCGPWCARAVLVDTEPRVIRRCLDDNSGRESWGYDRACALWRQGGAGNSWALGACHLGPLVADEVLDNVHRETERCDRLDGFLAIQSVAGGTGAGLGSYVLGLLRDAFSSAALASLSIWPFESGEVSVQSYNAVLTMAAAYEHADMVLLCENERYLEVCRHALRETQPSLSSLNRAICYNLVHALLPSRCPSTLGALTSPLSVLSGHLCAHPSYRLVTARALPQIARGAEAFASDSWAALQSRLVRMCEMGSLADAPLGVCAAGNLGSKNTNGMEGRGPQTPRSHDAVGPRRSVASAAFLLGRGAADASVDGLHRLPVWSLALDPLQVRTDPHEVTGLERSLGLLTNCPTVLPTLSAAGSKAASMLRASAYLHQYERYGVGREEMSEALLAFSQVVFDYEQL